MKIFIGNDHRGIDQKSRIIKYLNDNKIDVENLGTNSLESTDYPIYAKLVCEAVLKNPNSFGIVICGTGIGMSIACNKIKGIRCGKVDNSNEAFLTRSHNDANVIALNEKTKNVEEIIDNFLNTKFSNDEKHIRRINMIKDIENES